jgi:hypothetical protein
MFIAHATTLDALHDTALDRNRHMRTTERWESLSQDVRYAARRLTREPTLTAFTVATLALGLGANVTAFSVFDRVLLRGPEHVRDPDQLVRLYVRTNDPPAGVRTMAWLPHTAFETLDDVMTSVDAMAAYRVDDMMVGTGAASRIRRVSRMSPEMFGLLGVRAMRGRFFGDTEDAPVVVVATTPGERNLLKIRRSSARRSRSMTSRTQSLASHRPDSRDRSLVASMSGSRSTNGRATR